MRPTADWSICGRAAQPTLSWSCIANNRLLNWENLSGPVGLANPACINSSSERGGNRNGACSVSQPSSKCDEGRCLAHCGIHLQCPGYPFSKPPALVELADPFPLLQLQASLPSPWREITAWRVRPYYIHFLNLPLLINQAFSLNPCITQRGLE